MEMNLIRGIGAYCPAQRFANDVNLYQGCVENRSILRTVGLRDQQDAVHNLAFLKRFQPEKLHSLLLSHKISVYKILDPTWVIRGRCISPKGRLEEIASLDVGEALRSKHEGPLSEKVLKPQVVHSFPNGNQIRGVLVQPATMPPAAISALSPYLSVDWNISEIKDGISLYSYVINRGQVSPETPLEFRIKWYMTVDGQTVRKSHWVSELIYSKEKLKVEPMKLQAIRFLRLNVTERPYLFDL